ncbi:unnamed protein product [Ilex paraguariensis]|uniref:Uncharacterized protein n=1 Tax=Ilex paraguariensis TaxID=185542 RepID=A0ABC8TDJ6_9AQUA
MHKEVPSKKPTKVTSSLATEVRSQVNPCPSTISYFVSESSIRSKEGVDHALSNEGIQGSLVTTQNVPPEQQPRNDDRLKQTTSWSQNQETLNYCSTSSSDPHLTLPELSQQIQGEILHTGNVLIQSSPIPKAPINIETYNESTSLVVDLSGIQENDIEKSASPVKSLLSSKVKNIDGIPIGTTRKKKQKQKSPNLGKVGVPKTQGQSLPKPK